MASPEKQQDDLVIRPARVEDCGVLTGLMLRSSAYDGRYRKIIDDYPVTPAMIGQNEVWAAELAGKIVGFYRLDVANADLDLMFVDDAVQGSGIGRRVFEHMTSFAATRGLREIRVVAHPPAADFYRRMGAVDVGVHQAAAADGWDRPILKLTVKP